MDFTTTLVQQPGVLDVEGTGIGFLPNWKLNQARKQSHPLNLLLIGAPGIGKRTFINCLFGAEIIPGRSDQNDACEPALCRQYRGERVEGGVRLAVTVNQVQGFHSAQSLDDPAYLKTLLDEVEQRHRRAFLAESQANRDASRVFDQLYHAVIYFISPTFHHFTPAEIALLAGLQKLTLVVPVIAKADMYTAEELQEQKISIRSQLRASQLGLLPDLLGGFEDSWLLNDVEDIASRWPLALISSTHIYHGESEDGQRARVYPWGVVDIDNAEYSDFLYLEKLLISSFYTLNRRFIQGRLYEEIWRPRFLDGVIATPTSEEDQQLAIPIQDLSLVEEETK